MNKKLDIEKCLEKILQLHTKYNLKEEGGYFRFSSVITNQFIQDVDSLPSQIINETSYLDKGSETDRAEEWSILKLKSDITVTVSLSHDDLVSNGLLIFRNWNHFLEYRQYFFSLPDDCLLLNEGLIFSQSKDQKEVFHYKGVVSVLQLLKNNADHVQFFSDKIIDKYVFLHRSSLSISLKSLDAHFLEMDLDGLKILNSIFEDDSHKQQKRSILKEVLYSFLINISEEKRLEFLFKNFGEFSKRINENYHLFVSEFSFDKVRLEYEEKKREYLLKINDIFSSIQAKMLGVPVSIVLAAIELNDPENSFDKLSALLLYAAIVIYSVFMLLLLKNQNHTLKSIKEEYTGQMNRLKFHYAAQYKQIGDLIGDLDKRARFQKGLLIFCAVVIALLDIAVIIFFFYENQIQVGTAGDVLCCSIQ